MNSVETVYPLDANGLPCIMGRYYVGHILDLDGGPWVDKDTAQKILNDIHKKSGELERSTIID